jgi:4-amino-4-deoxy-L-arabinose transferase-like glycosyltransferase
MADSTQSKQQFPSSNRFIDRFIRNLPSRLTSLLPSANPVLWILLIVLFINVLLVSPKLMPGFADINPYDEAKYVESGWLLLKGEIRSLAWGPLVALFYAPVHLLSGSSLNWFMIEAWAGRFLLFICLWLSLTYLAFRLKGYAFREDASPFITVGLLFVTIPLFPIIENQSDAVFVSLSVLSVANLVAYARYHRLKNVGWASVFVGLGALARVETVVLLGTLVVLALAIGWRQLSHLKILAASLLPAIGILACLSLVNLVNEGNLNLGVSNKSYESFEMNQSILTGGNTELARQEARRLFGTEEENKSSVVRAILRNPRAFGLRIWANAKGIPWSYFYFFGKTQGFVLLLFSALGVYALIRKRAYALLLILFLWPLHAAIPLGFLAKHVIPQTYYLPMILASIGIASAFDLDVTSLERAVLLILSVLFCLYSWIDHKPAFLIGSLLITVIYSLAWLFRARWGSSETVRLAPMLLLLSAGLILRGSYPFPQYTTLGKSSAELGVQYLEQNLAVRTNVLVPFPLPAVAAKMVDITTSSVPKNINTSQELWKWLTEKKVGAAYVDDQYPIDKNITDLLGSGVGQYFELGFVSKDKQVRVYRVKDKVNACGGNTFAAVSARSHTGNLRRYFSLTLVYPNAWQWTETGFQFWNRLV